MAISLSRKTYDKYDMINKIYETLGFPNKPVATIPSTMPPTTKNDFRDFL